MGRELISLIAEGTSPQFPNDIEIVQTMRVEDRSARTFAIDGVNIDLLYLFGFQWTVDTGDGDDHVLLFFLSCWPEIP